MKFHIVQHGIYGKWQANVHFGTWNPMKHKCIGPLFNSYEEVSNYIRSLRK